MPDKSSKLDKKQGESKSGIMPIPILEPRDRSEPPMQRNLPEVRDVDDGATTGITPIVTEGKDVSAEREDDPATHR